MAGILDLGKDFLTNTVAFETSTDRTRLEGAGFLEGYKGGIE
jgi:hypothetical protein